MASAVWRRMAQGQQRSDIRLKLPATYDHVLSIKLPSVKAQAKVTRVLRKRVEYLSAMPALPR